ncbi:hypothetical protein KR093_000590 [Drosophila rubida]|uniref:C2H2-type domain-containing protein n=1 Tax=Drosophila rubida TaxID=30044 RepID=A0AAD4JXD4_9MUSC|nr:hypothetical protein KR093_000590 [Drosophila rubida]
MVASMSSKYTPDVAELLPDRKYRCELCNDQVFGNQSHYQLHLRRRHKVNTTNNQAEINSYHCPVEKCIYHAARTGSRGFANLRFLRQHYQKIHMLKEFKCNECNETFLLERHLKKHQCCSVYPCAVCGLTYSSKASLQTHMRRKGHLDVSSSAETASSKQSSSKVPLPTLQSWKRTQQDADNVEKSSTTAENNEKISKLTELPQQASCYYLPTIEIPYVVKLPVNAPEQQVTQQETETVSNVEPPSTDNELPIPSFTDEEVERLLRDMETQTDDVDLDTLDMHNEVLVPLLRNIQTQTLDNRHHQGTMTELDLEPQEEYNNTTAENGNYATYPEQDQIFGLQTSAHMHTQTCDELFEELGLSHIQTQTHCPDGLYNTQHTQTCDEMLDEFLENFQSTCTQTRWLDWQEPEEASN